LIEALKAAVDIYVEQHHSERDEQGHMLNRTSGDWHRGHLLLHRQLLDSAIEQ
jgi:hypothetical protein